MIKKTLIKLLYRWRVYYWRTRAENIRREVHDLIMDIPLDIEVEHPDFYIILEFLNTAKVSIGKVCGRLKLIKTRGYK